MDLWTVSNCDNWRRGKNFAGEGYWKDNDVRGMNGTWRDWESKNTENTRGERGTGWEITNR